jgi:glutamate synthase domain-containing protein 2/glutamate synthase domain-containing protein 1/glutamate synthase domain-containing protein 3
MTVLKEKSACGVGFVASRQQISSHDTLRKALHALTCVEHRGACSADQLTGDGSGIMTDIPFKLLGYQPGTVAVATLFFSREPEKKRLSLKIFEDTFAFLGMPVLRYREVPVNREVLGKDALASLPTILQAILERPEHCRTDNSFDKRLYAAKQLMLTKLRQKGITDFFLPSLSVRTIVYKALTRAADLEKFYPDLQNPDYKTRFAFFHRRFSTNTTTSWDKAQPFRLVGHNGEINTIAGNRSWASAREKTLGLPDGELLTSSGISDSGTVNEIVEALRYRSSIPTAAEALAIMMPPAHIQNSFYKFWSRAMEPWDGPALMVYADGATIGARLDRNGFRPCRWALTETDFYLSSEAGSFEVEEELILQKGMLHAGSSVTVTLRNGEVSFEDPSQSRENFDSRFDPRLFPLEEKQTQNPAGHLEKKFLFHYTEEDFKKVLLPMIAEGKEAIGSMGDTARLAVFSDEPRSFFDFFYHNFAQVTNPPLDYLREKMVTDLSVYLGKRPNIFATKELSPLPVAFELKSPVLSLGQMEFIREFTFLDKSKSRIFAREIDISFEAAYGVVGFKSKLADIARQMQQCVKDDVSVVILSDRNATFENPAIPSLLALRAAKEALHHDGLSLNVALILDTAEIRNTHHVAACIGLGATAVCPYLALEIARFEVKDEDFDLTADRREKNLLKALEQGLLKIMSKMGISVVRSYQNAKLFTTVGLDEDLMQPYFPGVTAKPGGVGLEEIVEDILRHLPKARQAEAESKLLHTYQFKEHARGQQGEKHAMTAGISKLVHELVRTSGFDLDNIELYREYLRAADQQAPLHLRHLYALKKSDKPLEISRVQPQAEILKTFGSGAMSFGAISAEAQRDIFVAMHQIGGRSNSGEGGENPFYFSEGITAHIKQVASGRFGVNALYLVSANEIQIKMAQGAKPGEGGQLMAVKVDEHIAKARHSFPNVDLISPPPLHDIYSIEDLKELIYQLRQVNPQAKINVKLVAGADIGTIAVGVAKAGADIIHISGSDGGTGAASLSSMKSAGLPWEFGLAEAHNALTANNLRNSVTLRVDGGLHTGKDLMIAAILGAEEFEFGKLLLVSQGCIMARICEKNTCPTGIATHDPKFKAKYKGTPEQIVTLLQYLAEDVREKLAATGVTSLRELIGRNDLLEVDERHTKLFNRLKISILPAQSDFLPTEKTSGLFTENTSLMNERLVRETEKAIAANEDFAWKYAVHVTDRAVMATLAGKLSMQQHEQILHETQNLPEPKIYTGKLSFTFLGSAGQGFGVFLTEHFSVRLEGEANDSVAKSMSGGRMVIVPSQKSVFQPEDNVIIGNCALYGATGGLLYVNGKAGDRFAVRNSGATALVEGTGLHACEYMTRGKVVVLGETSWNMGSGMTGGELIVYEPEEKYINTEYLSRVEWDEEELQTLKALLKDYLLETRSPLASRIVENWTVSQNRFVRYLPVKVAARLEKRTADPAAMVTQKPEFAPAERKAVLKVRR